MRIELKGGPFDGHIIHDAQVDKYLVVESGVRPRPIYRCAFCECCAHDAETVDYQFVGYEDSSLAPKSVPGHHRN